MDANITGDGKIVKGTFYENRDGTDKDHFAILHIIRFDKIRGI